MTGTILPIPRSFLLRVASRWELPFLGLLAIGALLLFPAYGLQWDSMVHTVYGERVLDYWLSGGTDRRAIFGVGVLKYYGVLFELGSAVAHRLLGIEPYALRGLFSAVAAIATFPPVIRIGRRLGGESAAIGSALALLLSPAFFGHAFINQKDVPLACGVAWCAWMAVRQVVDGDFGWTRWCFSGVAIGAALGIRVGAGFVTVFWGAPAVVAVWEFRREWRSVLGRYRLGRSLAGALLASAVVWVMVVPLWPFVRESPRAHLIDSLNVARAFPVNYPELFNGATISSDQLPRAYLPVYLALSLPPVLLAALAVGFGLLIRSFRDDPLRRRLYAVVIAWGPLPIAAAVILHPNLYDGMRHFLFTVPAFAVFMGWGLAAAMNRAGRLVSRPMAGRALVGLALASAIVPLVRWHPYQYAYTNFLAGEPGLRHRRWETDYWVTSYREAAEWINARQAVSSRPLHVVVAANEQSHYCFGRFVDSRVQWGRFLGRTDDLELPAGVDYYVSTVRYGLSENFPKASVAHVIGRAGVTFTVVKGRAKWREPATGRPEAGW